MNFNRRGPRSNDFWGRVFLLLIVLVVGLYLVDQSIGLDGIFQRFEHTETPIALPTATVPLVFAPPDEYVFAAPTEAPATSTPIPTPTLTPTPFIPQTLITVLDETDVERSSSFTVIGQCEERFKASRYVSYDPLAQSYRPLTDPIPYLAEPDNPLFQAFEDGIVQRGLSVDFLSDFPVPIEWRIDKQYKFLAVSPDQDAIVIHRWETNQESLNWLSKGSDSLVKLMDLPNSLEHSYTDPEDEWLILRYINAEGQSDLAALDLTTGSLQTLTAFQDLDALGGVLSWDGSYLAYWTEEGIWVIKLDGSFGALVFPEAEQASWSPQGDELVMVKDNRLMIGALDIENGAQTGMLTLPVRGDGPIWSSDGQSILYWHQEQADCTLNLWDLAGGFHEEVFRTQNSVCRSIDKERWSPDGEEVIVSLMETANPNDASGDILCDLASRQCRFLRFSQGDYPCRESVWTQTTFPYVWEFEDSLDGWYVIQQLTLLKAENGALITRSLGDTPVLNSPRNLNINADVYPVIEITMRVTGGKVGEINFVTAQQTILNPERLFPFDLIPDGENHRYRIDLREYSEWDGIIKYLRIRLTDEAAVDIEIQSIRILPAADS